MVRIVFISTLDEIDMDMEKQMADFQFIFCKIWYLRITDPGENKIKIGCLLFCVHIYSVSCRNENYSEQHSPFSEYLTI